MVDLIPTLLHSANILFVTLFFAFSVVGGKDKGQASNDNKGRALENAGNNEGKRGPSNDDYGRTEELMTG